MVAGKSHKESQGSMLLGAYPFASAAEAPDETSGPWRLLLPPWANVPSPVSTHELVVVGMLEHSAKTRDGSSHSGAMSGAVLSSEEKLHEGLDRRVTPRGSVVKALHESAQPDDWSSRERELGNGDAIHVRAQPVINDGVVFPLALVLVWGAIMLLVGAVNLMQRPHRGTRVVVESSWPSNNTEKRGRHRNDCIEEFAWSREERESPKTTV